MLKDHLKTRHKLCLKRHLKTGPSGFQMVTVLWSENWLKSSLVFKWSSFFLIKRLVLPIENWTFCPDFSCPFTMNYLKMTCLVLRSLLQVALLCSLFVHCKLKKYTLHGKLNGNCWKKQTLLIERLVHTTLDVGCLDVKQIGRKLMVLIARQMYW